MAMATDMAILQEDARVRVRVRVRASACGVCVSVCLRAAAAHVRSISPTGCPAQLFSLG